MIEQPQEESPEQPELAAPPIVRPKPKRAVRVWVSYLLFAVSAVLFVVVLALYIRGRNDEDTPPPPTAQAGQNEMKDVMAALQRADLDAEYGRSADRAIGVTEVAQSIVVNSETIYVFIFPDATQRQRDQDALAAGGSLEIVNTRGTPVAQDPPFIFGGSNVLVAVYTDDESLREDIQTAIEGLG